MNETSVQDIEIGRLLTQAGASLEVIPSDELTVEPVRKGLKYWQGLRGARAFPARQQIEPRAIAKLLRHVTLVKVINGGEDFHFAIACDTVQESYRTPIHNRNFSAIAQKAPVGARLWLDLFRGVCSDRNPVAVRFNSGACAEVRYMRSEVIVLPLGPSDDMVDHIMTVGQRILPSLQ